ncbi:MAG: zf-HC2 domain-containing protein [Elusimicrobia bacterium]|nr:zf-HC2 domain-containing protein [Elusimicrobiota bacterium]
MNCHATRAVLDLHAEGRLTPRREKAVAAHLDSCAECRSSAAPAAAPLGAPAGDFKSRLAAALKAERRTPAPSRAPAPALNLWPRDLSGVAVAAAALALIAAVIGWSGAPSQQYDGGDELAAGRMP